MAGPGASSVTAPISRLIANTLYAATEEHLQSLKTARAYGATDRNYAIFSDLSRHIADTYVTNTREQAVISGWFQIGAALILMPVLYVSVRVIKVSPAELLLLAADLHARDAADAVDPFGLPQLHHRVAFVSDGGRARSRLPR